MLQIVRLFLHAIVGFCLTISVVWADESQIDLPKVVIDYSGVAANVYQLQGKLWLLMSLVAVLIIFVAYTLLNTSAKKTLMASEETNNGDVVAKHVSLLWLVFTMIILVGLALPLLRLWLAMNR